MLDYSIEIHETLPSTNNVVKRAIEEGAPEGLVVCTYEQTAGYGRLGRSWVSPQGGSYFSMLLRPNVRLDELPAVSLVTGIAMRRALAGMIPGERGDRVAIKWPNDIVIAPEFADDPAAPPLGDGGPRTFRKGAFQKITGISLERHAGATCIGVGTNVIRPFAQEDVGGKNTPAYLVDLMGDFVDPAVGPDGLDAVQKRLIMSVCSAFLHEFQPLYEQWVEDGMAPLVDEYSKDMCLQNHLIQMVNQSDQRIVTGVVRGVDARGRLLLAEEGGATVAVSSGEVTLL